MWVDKADVALSGDTGVMALSGSLSHEGRTDAAEQFRLDRQTGKATTTAAGTFARAGGTGRHARHAAPGLPRRQDFEGDEHAALRGGCGRRQGRRLEGEDRHRRRQRRRGGPSFTPSDFGWSSWEAGRYWYDLDIPAQFGYNACTDCP